LCIKPIILLNICVKPKTPQNSFKQKTPSKLPQNSTPSERSDLEKNEGEKSLEFREFRELNHGITIFYYLNV